MAFRFITKEITGRAYMKLKLANYSDVSWNAASLLIIILLSFNCFEKKIKTLLILLI